MFQLSSLAKKPFLLSVLVALLLFGVGTFFAAAFQSSNISLQHWFAHMKRYTSGYESVDPRIVVVEIDNATLGKFGFPMDRSHYAPVVDHLTEAGAAAIGFDIIFEDPSDPIADTALARSIEQSGRVLLGFSSIDQKPGKIYTQFSDYMADTGFFDVPSIGNRVHAIQLTSELRDRKSYDYFPLSLLKFAAGSEDFQNKTSDHGTLISPDRVLPYVSTQDDRMLVHFLPQNRFTRVSFQALADPDQFEILRQKIDFQDAMVLIGMTADGTKDIFMTPNGQDYGVYIHANTINTILQGHFTRYFHPGIEQLLLFVCLLIGCYFNFTQRGWRLIVSNIAVAVLFLALLQFVILFFTDLIPSLYAQFIAGCFGVLIVSNILRYVFENKDKKKLYQALGEYVSAEVSREILDGTGSIDFDGERKSIAIFFSDIQGFTSISETMSPEKLVYFLREYLGAMSTIIMDERGFINKYEGDAIMALWGVFDADTQSALHACNSALLQQKALQKLNSNWKQTHNFDPLFVRMGIHFGEAILGNIGVSGKKLEFTALGDSVNLASRLEGINKYYHSYICVSQTVYDRVQEHFEFRFLDTIRVKGKTEPIQIYELLDLKGEISHELHNRLDQFRHALELYDRQCFGQALAIFSRLVELGDGPSRTYAERCTHLISHPPEQNWDGIWTFSQK